MTHITMTRASRPSEESHYESDEPVRGLPARLPEGERMLWQGEPNKRILAMRTFHVRKIAIYSGALLAWDVFSTLSDGQTLADQGEALLQLAGLGAAALGIICLFCYAVSRTTVYTITSKRLVIRAGIALPKTINIPFAHIASAGVKVNPDGSGNVMLTPLSWRRSWAMRLRPMAKGRRPPQQNRRSSGYVGPGAPPRPLNLINKER